jgi:cytochrome c oxidase subunit 2
MNKKRMLAACLLAAGVMALAGCGGEKEKAAESPAPSAGEGKSIEIKAKNWEFDQKEIRVKQGETITISLKNEQGIHNILIKGYEKQIEAGKPVTFVADQTGEFEFICNIMCGAGHNDMVGKLIVE